MLWSNRGASDVLHRVRVCIIHPSIHPSIHPPSTLQQRVAFQFGEGSLHPMGTCAQAGLGRAVRWGHSPVPPHEPRENGSAGELPRVPSHAALIPPLLWWSLNESDTRIIQHRGCNIPQLQVLLLAKHLNNQLGCAWGHQPATVTQNQPQRIPCCSQISARRLPRFTARWASHPFPPGSAEWGEMAAP